MQHQSKTTTESYSFRDSKAIAQGFAQRRATQCAGFLLPHLQAGMRLLDCGCGPGSITLDLAAVVAPGEVVGIDLDPVSIELARQQAAESQLTQVRFEVANVYELPF